MPALVIRLEPALDQIADHRDQFIQMPALRRHFWIVAGGDERVLVPLNLKNDLILHAASLAYEMNFDKGEAKAVEPPLFPFLTGRGRTQVPARRDENLEALGSHLKEALGSHLNI